MLCKSIICPLAYFDGLMLESTVRSKEAHDQNSKLFLGQQNINDDRHTGVLPLEGKRFSHYKGARGR